MLIDNISSIEWKAQQLLHDYKQQGPLIQLISEELKTDDVNLLVIQGSFDPPLISHKELIHEAIRVAKKSFSKESLLLLFLFSLSHVEKEIDVQNNSLLGYRVLMAKQFLNPIGIEENLPYMIGISNVGRYFELTFGIKRRFPNISSINYIMGLDVFTKLFDPKFYKKALTHVLPDIFESNYIVAGRGETILVDELNSFLNSLGIPIEFLNHISFIKISNNLRYESSTNIRRQLALDSEANIPSVPRDVMIFLKKHQLYSKKPRICIPEFIVQTTTKFALKKGLNKQECLKTIHKVSNEINNSEELLNRVVEEFRDKKYLIVRDYIV